jgi:hypothetical protein
MDKKLINEDIKNMKYLFGYKPGRVISEQDIDYTTDDYLDTTEMDEEGKRHPERLVRHSDTNKLVGTHKHEKGFHPNRHGEELGFDFHLTDIPHGTKFGGVEVGDFDYDELDEDMFDGWDDPDNFKSIKITKDDDSEDVEDYLEDFGDDSEDEGFDFLPDEDNDHRDEMM